MLGQVVFVLFGIEAELEVVVLDRQHSALVEEVCAGLPDEVVVAHRAAGLEGQVMDITQLEQLYGLLFRSDVEHPQVTAPVNAPRPVAPFTGRVDQYMVAGQEEGEYRAGGQLGYRLGDQIPDFPAVDAGDVQPAGAVAQVDDCTADIRSAQRRVELVVDRSDCGEILSQTFLALGVDRHRLGCPGQNQYHARQCAIQHLHHLAPNNLDYHRPAYAGARPGPYSEHLGRFRRQDRTS